MWALDEDHGGREGLTKLIRAFGHQVEGSVESQSGLKNSPKKVPKESLKKKNKVVPKNEDRMLGRFDKACTSG